MFYVRAGELGLSHFDLAEMTVGMVLDMITERQNDEINYPYIAEQSDIDALVGG